MNNTPEISIVIPVFNEEDCLTNLIYRLLAVMQQTGRDYELIFVNDGSTDRTSELLNAFYEDHPDKVTLIEFNGNYGQYTAICAGFEQVRGIKVVTLDADLQNPPEEIPKLLQKMDEGHDYVGGIRCKRKDNLMRRWCSKAINSIREKTTQIKITDQGCMMRAYSRSIVDTIAQAQEKSVFISALAYKYASNPAEVEVAHDERTTGQSRYSYFGLIKLNFDLLTGFTLVPLQAMTLVGILVSLLSMSALIILLVLPVFFGADLSPILLLVSGLVFLGGILLTGLGLIGEYVGRIYQAVLKRPNYLIKNVAVSSRGEDLPMRAVK